MPHEPWTSELEATRFSITKILQLARSGVFRIPIFQRSLRWQRAENLLMLDSLYRGYPVGTLLCWKHHAPANRLEFGGFSLVAEARSDALWIVDGQQRVTAIVGTLLHRSDSTRHPSGAFALCFDLEQDQFIASSAQMGSSQIPVNKLADPVLTSMWAREAGWGPELHRRAEEVGAKLRGYEIPVYISQARDSTALRTIFDRTNTAGRQMRATEIFEALNRGLGENPQPAGLLDRLQATLHALQFGRAQRAQTLQKALVCVAGYDPKDNLPRALREPGAALAWEAPCAAALERTIEFLREEAQIPHAAVLPYDLPLIGLPRFFHLFPDPCERSVELLVRWVWRGIADGTHMVTNQHLSPLYKALKVEQNKDEELVVQRLLSLVPRQAVPALPRPGEFNLRGARTRLGLCALLRDQPLHPISGRSLSPVEIFETTVADLNPSLFPNEQSERKLAPLATLPELSVDVRGSVAARFLVPSNSPGEFSQALRRAPDECLASHAIPASAWESARAGDWSAVVRVRAQRLEEQVKITIQRGARWGEDDDGPSVEGALSDAYWMTDR